MDAAAKTDGNRQVRRGRRPGSRNTARALPAVIHPEQRLTIGEMSAISGKSRSFFETNLSLARAGRKHTAMPPVSKVGRNVVCKAADFFAWLDSDPQRVDAAA